MAPDRRKKRLYSSSSAGCSISQEKRKQCAAKRKKLGIPQDSGMASVVTDGYTNLADILNVPHTSIELKDLTGVLSYEVWHSHFSDEDRNILTQYLPRGADPDKLVQELLSGDNFHFGNPFLKWGASLCSGKLQPDDVLYQEQYIKAKKKMYLSELQKYHDDMIERLLRWKDTVDRCKDSQEETLHNIWKSRKQSGKKKDLCEMLYINEDGDITTPESSSQATSDKACCNSNFLHIPGDYHRRNFLSDSNVNETSDGPKVAVKPQIEEKLQKRNLQLCDSAKNMSYIKPFEVFEEEERQKLRDYWFQLVTRDFPAFYVNWREKKLKAQELVKSVCQDLEQKLKLQEKDDENDSSHNLSPAELANNVDIAVSLSAAGAREDEKIEVSHTLIVGQMANQVGSREIALPLENEEDEKTDYTHERQRYDGEEDGGKLATINFREHVSGIHDGSNIMVDPAVILPELAGNMNHMNDVWSAVRVGGSFYHPATYGGEFSQAAEMIDLEAEASGREVLHDDLCFHDSFPEKNEGFNANYLPKRMGLDFDEAMATDLREKRMNEESNIEEWGGGERFCLPDCWGHQSWNSGLDQTLFSVLSGCNAFSAPTPAPPPTTTSIPMMDGSEQSSGVSLEWMGVSSGILRSWNQY